MENKEYLFGLIALTEKDVIVEQIETLKLRDDADEEVLRLVSEETDSFDDLTVGLLHDIGSKRWGQL